MKLVDTRKLSPDAQETIRLRAIRLVLDGGKSRTAAAELLGVTRVSVSNWVSVYLKQGEGAILKKKRGRRFQDKRLLAPHQCATIVNMIKDRCPDQLKMPFALWTREAVGNLIERRFSIKLSIRSVGNYLKRWGFTPQEAARAKAEKAEIHWGDEAGFRSDHQTGTSYSPRGQTPVVRSTGKRFRVNMTSTVTNKGTLRFMLFEESFTAKVFLNFLKRLIKGSEVKIFLILDNLRVHHAKILKGWLEENKDKIELFYLPSYSPELNPDELLNQDVKSNAVGRKRARTLRELINNITQYLFGTQKCPDIVQSYFLKSEVCYAA